MIGLSDRLEQALPPQVAPSKGEDAAAWWAETGCLAVIFGVAAAEIVLLFMMIE